MENFSAIKVVNTSLKPKKIVLSLTDVLFSTNRAFLFLVDFIIIVASYNYFIRFSPFSDIASKTDYHNYVGSVVYAICFCLSALGLGYYERTRRYSYYKVFTNGALSSFIALSMNLAVMYFIYYDVFGRKTFLWGTVGGYLSVTIFRLLLSFLYRKIPYTFTTVGDSPLINEIVSHCSNPLHKDMPYFKYVAWSGEMQSWEKAENHMRFCDVVFSRDALKKAHSENTAVWALKNGYRVIDENEMYCNIFEKVNLDGISKSWLIFKGVNARNFSTELLVRLMDITVSAIGLVVLLPMYILIAIGIKFSSGGDILFVQPRMGRYGKKFSMYKFRTMHQHLSKRDASGGFTTEGDSRVFAFGKFLRPLHLDELPQLWNILAGHMSLVGPRPEAVSFAHNMVKEIDLYEMRYLIRPGLTGHAQLMCGYAMDTIEDTKVKLAYDLYYLINYNIFFYFRVVLRTAFVVLKRIS